MNVRNSSCICMVSYCWIMVGLAIEVAKENSKESILETSWFEKVYEDTF